MLLFDFFFYFLPTLLLKSYVKHTRNSGTSRFSHRIERNIGVFGVIEARVQLTRFEVSDISLILHISETS